MVPLITVESKVWFARKHESVVYFIRAERKIRSAEILTPHLFIYFFITHTPHHGDEWLLLLQRQQSIIKNTGAIVPNGQIWTNDTAPQLLLHFLVRISCWLTNKPSWPLLLFLLKGWSQVMRTVHKMNTTLAWLTFTFIFWKGLSEVSGLDLKHFLPFVLNSCET